MKIVIYTIDEKESPFCKDLKAYLQSQKLQFEEKRVDTNRDFLSEMQQASDNFAGVPFTFIVKDSGEEVKLRGFTQSEFEAVFNPSATPPSAESLSADPKANPVNAPEDNSAVPPTATPASPAIPSVPPAPSASPASDIPAMPDITAQPAPASNQQTSAGNPGAKPPTQNELDKILDNLNTSVDASTAGSANQPPATTQPPVVTPSGSAQQPAQPPVATPSNSGQTPSTGSAPAQSSVSAVAMPQMPDFPQKQVN